MERTEGRRRAARRAPFKPAALVVALGAAMPLSAGTVAADAASTTPKPGPANVAIANPAAIFCVESGGRYEIRRSPAGDQAGFCLLPGGEEIDAWEYFRARVGGG